VQRVALERGAALRRHGELLVVVVEPVLAHLEEPCGGKARAHRRPCAVGGNGGCERDLVLVAAALIAQPQPSAFDIHAEARLVEAHGDTAVARRFLDQHPVELGAAH